MRDRRVVFARKTYVRTGRWTAEYISSETHPSLVFVPTDLSILARCTFLYATAREEDRERWMGERAKRGEEGGGGEEAVRRRGALEEDKPARLNYC